MSLVVTVVYGGQYHFRYKDSDLKKGIFKLQNVRSEFVTIIILADIVVNVADVILPVFLDFPEVARGESISASYCDDIIIAHRIYAIMNNKA
jgi:hypothetical protein